MDSITLFSTNSESCLEWQSEQIPRCSLCSFDHYTVSKEPRGQPGVRSAVLSSQPPLWEKSPDAAVLAPSLTGTGNHQGFSIGTPSESAKAGMTQPSSFAKLKEQKPGCQLSL